MSAPPDDGLATQLIGWASSAILVLTLGNQVWKQWKTTSTKALSKWLYLGQMLASLGFVIYSVRLRSWVFVATNSLILGYAVIGVAIVWWRRRSSAEGDRDR